jgi:hypothetical protein
MASSHDRLRSLDDDLVVLAVSDDGDVLMRMPGGHPVELKVPPQLAPYYRRLVARP